jgi:hypothetical protein
LAQKKTAKITRFTIAEASAVVRSIQICSK